MTPSESFDPQAVDPFYELFTEAESPKEPEIRADFPEPRAEKYKALEYKALEPESALGSSLPEPVFPESAFPEPAPESAFPDKTETSPFINWQEHLLPISCVAEEDSLTVLRMELETAHQLLQYQQGILDSLTEQLTNRDLQLQHVQTELSSVQQTCDRHFAKLTESEGICRDLKTQLRRQQQRVLQYRNLLSDQVLIESAAKTTLASFSSRRSVIAMGYESVAVERHGKAHSNLAPQDPTAGNTSANLSAQPLSAKPNPVSAWSAPRPIGLTGPLACYRKLATIRMAPSQTEEVLTAADPAKALTAAESNKVSVKVPAKGPVKGPLVETIGGAEAEVRVELPSFTRQGLS